MTFSLLPGAELSIFLRGMGSAQDYKRVSLFPQSISGRKHSHPVGRNDPICPAWLIIPNDLTLTIDLNTAKDVLRPEHHQRRAHPLFGMQSTYHAILPNSGGFLVSLRCTHPPTPAPPAPPSALAPPAPPDPPRPLRPAWMKLKPPGDANACACAFKSGSFAACLASTSLRMVRKRGFSRKLLGVGGTVVVVPMASEGFGGFVSRYVRRWVFGLEG